MPVALIAEPGGGFAHTCPLLFGVSIHSARERSPLPRSPELDIRKRYGVHAVEVIHALSDDR